MAKFQKVEEILKADLGMDLQECAEEGMFGMSIGHVGICTNDCGYYVEGVEPDAEGYTCEDCGTQTVISDVYALFHMS